MDQCTGKEWIIRREGARVEPRADELVGTEQYAQQQRIAEAAALQAQALEALASVPEPVKKVS